MTIAFAWLTIGPALAVGEAQCTNNQDCGALQYCQKSTGDCDGEGLCTDTPSGCYEIWAPVCGCDGSTYANECYASMAGVSIASEGECPPSPCQDNGDCSKGEFCEKTTGDCDGQGLCSESPTVCWDVWDPMCGCDGSTYGNQCEAAAAGVSVAYEGECLPMCSGSQDCLPSEYCDTAHNGCFAAGACRMRPIGCTEEYDPVCGCNELTYVNPCEAAAEGMTVARAGLCGLCPADASPDCIFSDALETGGTSRWTRVVED